MWQKVPSKGVPSNFPVGTCQTFGWSHQSISTEQPQISYTGKSLYLFFRFLLRWTRIQEYSLSNAYLILVGNKCDMEKDRAVTYEKEKQLAEQTGHEFFETSAKDNVNVLRVFERLVELIISDSNNDNDKDRYKMLKCRRFTAQKLTTNGDKIIDTPCSNNFKEQN